MSTTFEQAAKIRQDYNRTIERIRSDGDLHPEAKRRQVAEAHRQVEGELAALRQQYTQDIERERQRLHSAAFDLKFPATASEADKAAIRMAHRDAIDRTAGLSTRQDALNLLAQATRASDETLALAVAQRAFERGWHDVLEPLGEGFPARSTAVKNVLAFEAGQDTQARLEASMGLGTPARPPELAPVVPGGRPA